jgi:hypothetical protein
MSSARVPEHWNGRRWRVYHPHPALRQVMLYQVAGAGHHLWAVGGTDDYSPLTGTSAAVLAHWVDR